jgi:hypothetical protein
VGSGITREETLVFIAVSGGKTPEATGPQGACSTNGIPNVSRCHPLATDQQEKHEKSLTLQRLRERLEMEALAAGHPRPEQAAALQLLEVAP